MSHNLIAVSQHMANCKVQLRIPKEGCGYARAVALRKHALSNILKILPPKNGNIQIKNSDILSISAQNIECGYPLEPPRRGGSNAYPQFMFLCRNKKNNVYPCKPQFYYIKVGFKGSELYRHVFVMHAPSRFPVSILLKSSIFLKKIDILLSKKGLIN